MLLTKSPKKDFLSAEAKASLSEKVLGHTLVRTNKRKGIIKMMKWKLIKIKTESHIRRVPSKPDALE